MRFPTASTLVLCCLLTCMYCGQSPVLVVALANVPPATHTVEVLVRQGDRVADERPVYKVGEHAADAEFIYTFGLQPEGVTGSFAVGVAAFDVNHCLLMTGLAAAELDPGLTSTQLQIRLKQVGASLGKLCPPPGDQRPLITGFKQQDADPTQVVISGWGFLPGISVFVDGQAAKSIQSTQFTEITAQIPKFTSPSGLKASWIYLQNQNGTYFGKSIIISSISFESRELNTFIFPPEYEPVSISVGEINGDGLPDLVVAGLRSRTSGFVGVFRNQGGGKLATAPQILELPDTLDDLQLADMDRDGAVDVVAISASSGLLILVLNDGQGNFKLDNAFSDSLPAGTVATTLAVGNVLGDVYPDVVVASSANPNSTAALLFFHGSSTGIGFVGGLDQGLTLFGNVLIRDLDGDGRDDLVCVQTKPGALANQLDSNLRVILSDGTGSFTYLPTLATAAGAYAQVAALDLDGDSVLDLVASGVFMPSDLGGKVLSVYKGLGGKMYSPSYAKYETYPQPFSMAVGDFNRDGRSDLVVTHILKEGQGHVSILANIGIGTFADVALQPLYPIGFGDNFVAAGDFNTDGKSDFAVVMRGIPKIKQPAQVQVFLNTSL